MRRISKIVLGVLALLITLMALALFYVTSVFNPNDFKSDIQQWVFDKAGIELRIEQDIEWSLYPWLGIKLSALTVKYPDKPTLASIDNAQASLDLIALLSKRIEVDAILLDGLRISLHTDTDGISNWHAASPDADTPRTVDAHASNPSDSELNPFTIQTFTLKNADIRYENALDNTLIELSHIQLKTGVIAHNTPTNIDFETGIQYFKERQRLFKGQSQLSGQVRLSPTFNEITILPFSMFLEAHDQPNRSTPLRLDLTGEFKLNREVEQLQLKNLIANIENLSLRAELDITNFSEFDVVGNVASDPFDLKHFLNTIGIDAPQTANPQALRTVQFDAQLKGTPAHWHLSPLNIGIDTHTWTGLASFETATAQPHLELSTPRLNLNDYLPAPTDQSTQPSTASTETHEPSEIFNPDDLRALNLSANIGITELKYDQYLLHNLRFNMQAQNGNIDVKQLDVDVFGGRIRNQVSLNVNQTPATIALKNSVSELNLETVLLTLADTNTLTGALSASANLTARGHTTQQWLNTLSGKADVRLVDGVIQGIDMAQTLCQGIQSALALGINPVQVDRSTPFANMGGTFDLNQGVVSNNDLRASMDAMQLTGSGTVNLPQQALDYRLGFKVTENLFKQTCSVNNRLEGLELPILCSGRFDTPPADMCKPDTRVFTQLLRQELQRKVEEKLGGQVEEKLIERLGGDEGTRNLIRGLIR
ncbi:AsmA family protein [Nitrincola nitratireducens]|uniref:Putative assembly protein n=1 Tax=Nitrincola nitratireducens TaxID=1229521 RepID=W9UQ60_9GAMM|nr:AsmA family protein [Nitrincola nitratireducens]EXJ09254.1 putative assembly protein [Nitrincola nitratireducens]